MSTLQTDWKLVLIDSISGAVGKITDKLNSATKAGSNLGDCFKRIKAIDLMAIDQSVQNLKSSLQGVSDIAIKNESALAEVSAITGVTGKGLDELNDKAKKLAKTYGEDTNENLEGFKTILSRLGPEMGQSGEAMEGLGESVNVLSKGMEGDIKGATDAITTSMLQFQVDLKNPVKAAEESKRMINIMAAGAKEGASEIPQISAALVQAGGTAKLANVSFAETNSALQAMAQAGKYGSEAGVGLRNVLIKMNAPSALSKEAVEVLKKYKVNMNLVTDATVPFAERLKELQKIGESTDALAAVFGAENIQAAQGLINSAQYQEELTKKITGTNVAYEQAAVIMDTTSEKEKRRNQEWNIFKMRVGAVTKEFQPYINVTANAVSITANLKNAMDGLKLVWNAVKVLLGIDTAMKWINTQVTKNLTKEQLKLSFITNSLKFSILWASLSTFGLANAMQALKTSITSVSTSIMSIPVIGWILALVAVLTTAFVWLWNNVGEFRGFFYGIWEVIKLAFGGILEVIKSVINIIIGYFRKWLENIKTVFGFVVEIVNTAWNWVVHKFFWAFNFISQITGAIWTNIKTVFSGVYEFMKSTFGGIWGYVSDVFTKIWGKIQGFMNFIKPLTDGVGAVWDKVKTAFGKGMDDGKKEVEDEKREKKKENPTKTIAKVVKEATEVKVNPAPSAVGTMKSSDVFGDDKKGTKTGRSKIGSTGIAKEKDGMSMSGSGGARTINMTINQTNNFSIAKGIGNLQNTANKVIGAINDRLRDGLVAID